MRGNKMITTNNMSLWQLTTEHQKLLSELYDHDTGEVNEIVQAKLNDLEPTIEKKCVSVTKYINHLEFELNELETMRQQIDERQSAYLKEIKRYRNYLEINMEKQGIKKVSCPYFTIKLSKNPYSVEIINEDLIPSHFMKTREIIRTETKPDKTAIKEHVLQDGEQVPGAYVHQKNKLEIVIDKL
jgi:rRNA maturation protein Rpf1